MGCDVLTLKAYILVTLILRSAELKALLEIFIGRFKFFRGIGSLKICKQFGIPTISNPETKHSSHSALKHLSNAIWESSSLVIKLQQSNKSSELTFSLFVQIACLIRLSSQILKKNHLFKVTSATDWIGSLPIVTSIWNEGWRSILKEDQLYSKCITEMTFRRAICGILHTTWCTVWGRKSSIMSSEKNKDHAPSGPSLCGTLTDTKTQS